MSACITTPKINGQPLGGGGAPADPNLLFSQTSDVTVNNVLLNTIVSYNMPGGTAANDGDVIVIDFWGYMISANAGSVWSFGYSLDTVVHWFDTSAVFGASATVRPWRLKATITRRSAVLAVSGGAVNANNTVAVPINGIGDITLAPQGGPIGSPIVDSAADWANAQLLDIAVQANIAGGNSFVLRGGTIKLETIA